MADSGMFGAPIGISAAIRDQDTHRLSEMSLALDSFKLQEAQQTLDQGRKMMEIMQRQDADSQNQGDPAARAYAQSNKLMQLSLAATEAGLYDKGARYAEMASTIAHHTSEIQTAQQAGIIKNAKSLASILQEDDPQDQASFQTSLQRYALATGDKTLLRGPNGQPLQYSPELVKRMEMAALDLKERTEMQAAEARTKASLAEAKNREIDDKLKEAQTRYENDRADKLEKEGVIDAKSPKAADIKAVTDLIFDKYGDSVNDPDKRIAARQIVPRMLSLIKESHLSYDEAASKAFQEADEKGMFGGATARTARPGSKARPLDIPSDPARRRAGWYKSDPNSKLKGAPVYWTGDHWSDTEDKP